MASNIYSGKAGDFEGGIDPLFPGIPDFIRRISWASVFAGSVVAVMVSLLLSILGIGIGMGMIDPQANQSFSGLGVGSGIWWMVSSILALILGGWVAARVSGASKPFAGMFHGLLTWGVVTLVTFFILTTALGRLIGGTAGLLGQGMTAAGLGAVAMAEEGQPGGELQGVMDEIRRTLQGMGAGQAGNGLQGGEGRVDRQSAAAGSPDEALHLMQRATNQIAEGREEILSASERETLINGLVAHSGLNREQAQQTVNNWIQSGQQLSLQAGEVRGNGAANGAANGAGNIEQQAREIGGELAAGVSQASWWTLLALVFTGGAGALGGFLGTNKYAASIPENRV